MEECCLSYLKKSPIDTPFDHTHKHYTHCPYIERLSASISFWMNSVTLVDEWDPADILTFFFFAEDIQLSISVALLNVTQQHGFMDLYLYCKCMKKCSWLQGVFQYLKSLRRKRIATITCFIILPHYSVLSELQE